MDCPMAHWQVRCHIEKGGARHVQRIDADFPHAFQGDPMAVAQRSQLIRSGQAKREGRA